VQQVERQLGLTGRTVACGADVRRRLNAWRGPTLKGERRGFAPAAF